MARSDSGAHLAEGPATATLPSADPVPINSAPSVHLPVTVTDHDGRRVTITDTSRIVALDQYGTYGTTVFALGLGSHLVGRDIATKFPAAQSIPNLVADGTSVNIESVIAVHPTVVLTDASLPSVYGARQQLERSGIPVVVGDPARTVASSSSEIEFVADALGVPEAGQALAARTQSELAQARSLSEGHTDDHNRPRVAFIYARGTGLLILGGPGSGADSLIEAIGAEDAGTAAGLHDAFTSLTSEGLIAAKPDALLMMTDGLKSVGGVDGLEKIPGVVQTPAGAHHRVIDADDGQLLSFGPRTGEVAIALARALYRQQS
ncbi:ABC transporter substrate-binding protein [Gordonia jinhuaensis]|uniref:ABC transporter substrate-binding protein n=2 Tax=Gordonia jinhuaensis TaxID=1517702 RepID=A0A916WYY6_9ACTN|nr:ABC transporter substrate-binding protein [Gordonia jinhuaensis]